MRIKYELLRKLRLERGWRQVDAAQAVGIDERTYRRYESGQANHGQNTTNYSKQYEILRDLAAVYNLDGPDSLIDETPDTHPTSPAKLTAAPANQQPTLQPPDAPYDPAWYVHREYEERRALNRLRGAGAPVVLQGPQLFGKGTLLGHLLDQVMLSMPSIHCARLNLATLNQGLLASLDGLLRAIAQRLAAGVPESDALLAAAWQRPGTEMSKLVWLLEKFLTQRTILLVLEKADVVHGLPYQDDFFAMLRGWCERGMREPWSRLRLIATVSTEPALLESTDHSSFFVLANPLLLDDFSVAQAIAMAQLYGLNPTEPEIESLLRTVGGSPYLLRLAFYECVVGEHPIEHILSGTGRSVFTPHLLRLRGWLEPHGLLPIVQCMAEHKEYEISFEQYCRLYAKGLVHESATGAYCLRSRLYEHYFGQLGRKR